MRIAYYSSLGDQHTAGGAYGGADVSLSYLIDHALAQGHDVTLITDQGHYLAEKFRDRVRLLFPRPAATAPGRTARLQPAPCHAVARRGAFAGTRLLMGETREMLRLYRFFRPLRSQIDVYHSNYTGCEVNTIAARLAGFPLVLGSYRVLPDESARGTTWCRRSIEWLSVRSMHHGIAVSEATRRAWQRRAALGTRHTSTIYNGIDLEAIERVDDAQVAALRRQLDLPDGAIVIGHVGRLHPMKGQSVLLSAMARLARQLPRTVLLVAGDGPLRLSLQEQARALGIVDRVRFLGNRADVPLLLRIFDLFAFPSVHTETFGLAVAEAMAAGLPCVGSNLSGIPELISHGETGLVVPVGDAAALAAAMEAMARDGAMRRKMGDAGRTRARRLFDIQRCARQVFELYDRLLGCAESASLSATPNAKAQPAASPLARQPETSRLASHGLA